VKSLGFKHFAINFLTHSSPAAKIWLKRIGIKALLQAVIVGELQGLWVHTDAELKRINGIQLSKNVTLE
jgi:hypothetical protein